MSSYPIRRRERNRVNVGGNRSESGIGPIGEVRTGSIGLIIGRSLAPQLRRSNKVRFVLRARTTDGTNAQGGVDQTQRSGNPVIEPNIRSHDWLPEKTARAALKTSRASHKCETRWTVRGA